MSSPAREIEFEEQLKEAGKLLIKPPSELQELCGLLDKLEHMLANIEQAPPKSVQKALMPAMTALIAEEILRHPDICVRMTVASCMSEITRITAPDAPYGDDHMREIFQLTVAAFEKLSDLSGSFYSKAENILDIVAKVRTCLVMLDLECDDLIVEMFKIFLKVIRSDHPKAIYSAMEKTMTLVIDESEEISWDLLSTLLDNVRKGEQDSSSICWKLAEEVITKSASKLQPCLMVEVDSRHIILSEYADIVTTIYKSGLKTLQNNHLHGNGEAAVSKELESTCPKEVGHDMNGLYDSEMKKEAVGKNSKDSDVNDKSMKKLDKCDSDPKASEGREQSKIAPEGKPLPNENESKHLKTTNVSENLSNMNGSDSAEPEIIARKVESGIEQEESVPKKRGRKPNSLMNPEEGYDHSWICGGRKSPTVPNRRKSNNKGIDQTPSGNSDSKKPGLLLKLKVGGEHASSTPLEKSLPETSNPKKSRAKRKRSMVNEDSEHNSPHKKKLNDQVEEKETAPPSPNVGSRKETEDGGSKVRKRKRTTPKSSNVNLRKEPKEISDSETKQRKSLADEEATPSGREVTDKEDEVLGDLKQKPKQKADTKAKQKSDTKVKSKNVVADKSSNKKKFKKVSMVPTASPEKVTPKATPKASGDKKKNSKVVANSEDTPKREVKRKRSSGKDTNTASKVAVESSKRDESSSQGTPKTESKKKIVKKEVDSGRPEVNEELVGSRVKIWWPLDDKFYEGVVKSFSNIKKKHKILYVDGDVEVLDLKKEQWEIISSADKGKETEASKSNTSSDSPQKETPEAKVEPVSASKRKPSSRRKSTTAYRSKAKGRKSVAGTTSDKPTEVNDSTDMVDKPQEDDEKSIEEQMNAEAEKAETERTEVDSQQTAKTTAKKPKGKRRKDRDADSSEGDGLEKLGEVSKEVEKEEVKPDEVEADNGNNE